jgi:4a-hydroxytetrahydrobiopterin dehydratase
MKRFSEEEVQQGLASLSGWSIEGGMLVLQRSFEDFVAAMAFVNNVAQLAETLGHHPDIDIRYNRVRLALTTHDAGGLTQNDFDLAGRISALRN